MDLENVYSFLDVNWLFVIIKTYVKVNFKEINNNDKKKNRKHQQLKCSIVPFKSGWPEIFSKKISSYHRKTPVLESLFNKVAGLHEIFRNIFSTKDLRTTASIPSFSKRSDDRFHHILQHIRQKLQFEFFLSFKKETSKMVLKSYFNNIGFKYILPKLFF